MKKCKTIGIHEVNVRISCKAARRTVPPAAGGVTTAKRGPPDRIAHKMEAVTLGRRDALVLEHLPLARTIAALVHLNLPPHVDLDDLAHAGLLGLIDAASKFDPDKQVLFTSYAKYRIRGAILDSLRSLDWASRDMRRRQKQVEAATGDLTAKLQRAPTETELAENMGIDINRWRAMMLDLRNVGPVSPPMFNGENDDLPIPDFRGPIEIQPDSICARAELRRELAAAAKTLPERFQKIVLLYYSSELSMREIGAKLGINESRVSQIHKLALQKMAMVLHYRGIDSAHVF